MKENKDRKPNSNSDLDYDRSDEIESLLDDVAKSKGRPLDIDFSSNKETHPELEEISQSEADPDTKHKLYYKYIDSIKRRYVSDAQPRAKELIYNQIKLYLKEGQETGRDSRQAINSRQLHASQMLQDWVTETSGQDLVALYNLFRDANKKLGYIKEEDEK